MATDETTVTEQTDLPESETAAIVDTSVGTRKVSHWHQPDKRAMQQGPITGPDLVVGRQKKEPCYETIYHVKNPGGLKINEKLYKSRVIVPECVANTLCGMDREWEKVERALFRNAPVNQTVANL